MDSNAEDAKQNSIECSTHILILMCFSKVLHQATAPAPRLVAYKAQGGRQAGQSCNDLWSVLTGVSRLCEMLSLVAWVDKAYHLVHMGF